MLESFAFSRVKNQERLPIVKEMKKQLEMMKVAVKLLREMQNHLRSMTLNLGLKH